MGDKHESGDESLGADLLRVVARLNRWATRHGEWTLPTAQARILALAEDAEPARISDLARADHCSQPGMTSQVRRLEAAGLLTRISDPCDRRAVLVSLTADARRVLAEIRQARTAAIEPLLERLSPAELERVRAALGTLSDLLEAATAEPNASPSQE